MADTHTIMPKKLAQALMDAGMTHLDLGGVFGASNSFSQQAPTITTQSNLAPLVGTLQGQGSDIYGQQQNLASQLLAQSNGQGPNVAQDQLNQATGTNVSNQAALAASQRGAGANVGLLARQAAQQGAGVQQTAAGQAATLGAQQQLGAQQNLTTLQNNIANQNLQNQSIQQGAIAAQNATQTTGQLGAGQINAGVAGQNTSTSGGIAGGLLGGGATVLGSMLYKGGRVGGYPIKKYAAGGEVNDNLGIANFATAGGQNMGTGANSSPQAGSSIGSSMNSLGGVGSKLVKNTGSGTQSDSDALAGYANADSVLGSSATNPTELNPASSMNLGGSDFGGGISDMDPLGIGTGASSGDAGSLEGGGLFDNFLTDGISSGSAGVSSDSVGGTILDTLGDFLGMTPAFASDIGETAGSAAEGVGAGEVDALPAEGTAVAGLGEEAGTAAIAAYTGGQIPFSKALLQGGTVPGQAQVRGNSPKNDNQPTLLSPGEIVLPRSVTQSPDMEKKAIEFLRHVKKKGGGYKSVADAKGRKNG